MRIQHAAMYYCNLTFINFYRTTLCYCHVSVYLPVTIRYCTQTARQSVTETTPFSSAETLVFACQKSRKHFNGATPDGSAKYR